MSNDEILLEQYKLAVQCAQDASGWRQGMNKFYVALVLSMFTALGWLRSDGRILEESFLVLCSAGFIVSVAWLALIAQFRALNRAKFEVIQEMEKELPYPAFFKEWSELQRGRRWSVYTPTSYIEQALPMLAGLGFVVLALS